MKVTIPTSNSLNLPSVIHKKRLSHREGVHVRALTTSTKLAGRRVTWKLLRRAIKVENKGEESSITIDNLSAARSTRNNCQALASNSSMFVPWRIKAFIAVRLINESLCWIHLPVQKMCRLMLQEEA